MKTKKLNIVLVITIALIFAACDDGNSSEPTNYELGDIGPGGGKIFYKSDVGFTMTDTGETCYYLEVAPADMTTTLAWASSIFIPPEGDWVDIAGTETAIGTGRKNTALVLTTDPDAPAAEACNDYSNEGKTDWFLPSKDELDELYKSRDSVGNFGISWYWSSSQIIIYNAWAQNFNDGGLGYGSKLDTFSVRAIRAF